MEIVDLGCDSFSKLGPIVDKFNSLVLSERIKPKVRTELTLREFRSPLSRAMFATKGGEIRGYLTYMMEGMSDYFLEESASQLAHLKSIGIDGYGLEEVASVCDMESFPTRHGTGSKLMQNLFSKPGIKAVYATCYNTPSYSSIGFYEALGFRRAPGEHCGSPILVWKSE